MQNLCSYLLQICLLGHAWSMTVQGIDERNSCRGRKCQTIPWSL